MRSPDQVFRDWFVLPVLAVGLTACSESRTASADAALAQDLALAKQNAPLVVPADTALRSAGPAPLRVTPRAPTARPDATRPRSVVTRSMPAPVPDASPVSRAPSAEAVSPTPAGNRGTIGAGTSIAMSVADRICLSTVQPGDKFVAVVDQPVTGSNGALIPSGSKVVIEVASAEKGDNPSLTFRGRSLLAAGSSYDLAGNASPDSLERVRTTSGNTDTKKVLGGAVLGALAGQLLGKNTKSTVIGAAAGAAAGTVVATRSGTYDRCVPSGSKMRLVLSAPISVSLR
ncbi:MAG: hypothetical protein NVS4B3_10110 [Gemmatimonadaceae bacterium]